MTDDQIRLAIVKSKLMNKACDYCGIKQVKLPRCSKCYLGFYCCKNHQQKHWSKHKLTCNTGDTTALGENRIILSDSDGNIQINIHGIFKPTDNLRQVLHNDWELLNNTDKILEFIALRYPKVSPKSVLMAMYPSASALYRSLTFYDTELDHPSFCFITIHEAQEIFPDIDDFNEINNNIEEGVVIITVVVNSRFQVETVRLLQMLAINVEC